MIFHPGFYSDKDKNNVSPQLYTAGWTMLELLSPWFPTFPKDTGACSRILVCTIFGILGILGAA